jgi:hypothetical protein
MATNGVRKRLKIRWLYEADGDAHAFKMVDHYGRLSDLSLCGLTLGAMARWRIGDTRQRCSVCQKTMGRGARA